MMKHQKGKISRRLAPKAFAADPFAGDCTDAWELFLCPQR